MADALPRMHRLAWKTLQSCHLGIVEDAHVVILAQTNAPTNMGFYVKLVSALNLLDAASGDVLLANQTTVQQANQSTVQQERMIADRARETSAGVPIRPIG